MKNGIKYLVAGLVATGLTASASYAVITVNFNALDESFVTDNTGASGYLTGTLVEIGSFASAPTLGSSSLAGFTVFASTLSATGEYTGTGTIPSAGAFSHAQIYLVVFNGATPGASTQLAIADVSDASNAEWKFPADSDSPNSTTFDLDSLFATPGTAPLATGGQVIFGSTGVDGSGPYSLLETAPLMITPEPSTYLLVGTGLLGLVALRRRK